MDNERSTCEQRAARCSQQWPIRDKLYQILNKHKSYCFILLSSQQKYQMSQRDNSKWDIDWLSFKSSNSAKWWDWSIHLIFWNAVHICRQISEFVLHIPQSHILILWYLGLDVEMMEVNVVRNELIFTSRHNCPWLITIQGKKCGNQFSTSLKMSILLHLMFCSM